MKARHGEYEDREEREEYESFFLETYYAAFYTRSIVLPRWHALDYCSVGLGGQWTGEQ
jgi:hypothetical protein